MPDTARAATRPAYPPRSNAQMVAEIDSQSATITTIPPEQRSGAEDNLRPGQVEQELPPEHADGVPCAAGGRPHEAAPNEPEGDPHQGEERRPDQPEHPVRGRQLGPAQGRIQA